MAQIAGHGAARQRLAENLAGGPVGGDDGRFGIDKKKWIGQRFQRHMGGMQTLPQGGEAFRMCAVQRFDATGQRCKRTVGLDIRRSAFHRRLQPGDALEMALHQKGEDTGSDGPGQQGGPAIQQAAGHQHQQHHANRQRQQQAGLDDRGSRWPECGHGGLGLAEG